MGGNPPRRPYQAYRDCPPRRTFWEEIRRRRVFPFLGLFLASGFLVLEGVDQLTEHWGVSETIARACWIVYLYGIPGTVILAWFHGEAGAQKLRPIEILLHGVMVLLALGTCYIVLPEDRALAGHIPAGTVGPDVHWLSMDLPPDYPLSFQGLRGQPFALSPDGRDLVYVAASETGTQLVVRPVSQSGAQLAARPMGGPGVLPLPGTDGARHPFFSPNGAWVGYFARGQLMRVPVAGGNPGRIASVPGEISGASWGPRDEILFGVVGKGLYKVAASGGEPEPLPFHRPPVGETNGDEMTATVLSNGGPSWPDILPDGEHALVSYEGVIGVLSISTGEIRHLLEGEQALYLASGHLLVSRSGERLFLVSFDLGRMEVTGDPVPVLEEVFRAPGGGSVLLDVSDNGTLAFTPGGFRRSLVLVDRQGRSTPLAEVKRGYRWPRFDPTGNRVAVAVDSRPSEIWMFHVGEGTGHREAVGSHHAFPVWSPEGTDLAVWSDGSLLRWEVHSGMDPALLLDAPATLYPHSWSPDGKTLALSGTDPESGLDIVMLRLGETPSLDTFLATSADESLPQFHPGGRWIAYTSDAEGREGVYVTPYPGPGPEYLVSAGGGRDGLWSRDGTELFFRRGDAVMAVDVSVEPTFTHSEPGVLFRGDFDLTQMMNWDVSPDGRFVMVKADANANRGFQIVLNWFEELEARKALSETGRIPPAGIPARRAVTHR